MIDCNFKYCRWHDTNENVCSQDECIATEDEISKFRKQRTEEIVNMVQGQLNGQVDEIVKILGGE